MAISAYVGIPRSGKSYEVVSSVIVENFKKGRRIVTNIEGITEQALIDYCQSLKNADSFNLGSLIKVSDDDCIRDDFFPYKDSVDTVCQPGDLICIDEVWRVFPNDNIKSNHRSFIAEHGHFTDPETGVCCDLVVINQSVSGIPRFIKDRIETTYLMSRLIALGMPNRYRVNVYTGAKITKSSLVAQYQNKYDKAIFKLYKSFDGLNGKQAVIDSRQNFFKSGTFKLLIFSIIFLFSISYYFLSDVFSKYSKNEKVEEVKSAPAKAIKLTGEEQALKALNNAATSLDPERISSRWRISGEMEKNGALFVVLIDDKGNLRLEPKRFFKGTGRGLTGVIGGESVSYYSGVKKDESGKMLF